MSRARIFIQIAAYRDPQLLPTLRDCQARAAHPERLRWGICWQHDRRDSWDSLGPFRADPRVRVSDVPWQASRGACWARHRLQQLYRGERYTLCLDSHHRFAQDWDVRLIAMLEGLRARGHALPVLTAYLPAYDPAQECPPEERLQQPCKLVFDRFSPEGCLLLKPEVMQGAELQAPLRSYFLSAHFLFADGSFARELQHDPELYFHGEEISLAVRAHTHGYDLFHPHQALLWHEYSRAYRPNKHWTDHSLASSQAGAVDQAWYERDRASQQRLRRLLGIEDGPCDFGRFGLGRRRSLADYQQRAGIDFRGRCLLNRTAPPAMSGV